MLLPTTERLHLHAPVFAGLDIAVLQRQSGIPLRMDSVVWAVPSFHGKVWQLEHQCGFLRHTDFVHTNTHHRAAEQLGLAPRLLAQQGHWQWVACAKGEGRKTLQTKHIIALGKALRRLHHSGVSFQSRTKPFTLLQDIVNSEACQVYRLSSIVKALCAENVSDTCSDIDDVPLHGDINPGNVFIAPWQHVELIDWDYSAMGPAAWDIAIAMVEYGFDSGETDVLLAAYQATPEHLCQYCAVYACIACHWYHAIGQITLANARAKAAQYYFIST